MATNLCNRPKCSKSESGRAFTGMLYNIKIYILLILILIKYTYYCITFWIYETATVIKFDEKYSEYIDMLT